MKFYRYFYRLLYPALFVGLSACVNLQKVNDFAVSAGKGAGTYKTLPLSFSSICQDNCKEQDIKAGNLNSSKCDCSAERQADSVDDVFSKTIAGYLSGLDQLSADKTTDYQFDPLDTQLSGLNVPSETAGACAKLTGILTKAVTDGYRRNKLKAYICEADPPLQILLKYLRSNVSFSLAIKLTASKSKLEGDYVDLLRNSKENDYQRRQIIQEFYSKTAAIESQLTQLKAFGALLQTVAAGHRQLADNLDKFRTADLKSQLSGYARLIGDIRTQIEILRK